MNVVLLCLVLPVVFAMLLYRTKLIYELHHMSDEASRVAWGGLHGSLFRVWVATFLLSSFGCTSSFVLYASQDSGDSFPVVVFLAMNASVLAFDHALLHNMTNLVLVCLWTNIFVFAVLFVQTAVVFDVVDLSDSGASAGLLVATHVCNLVGIFHVYVMDLLIWHAGWTDAHAAYKASPLLA
jgi:hypothetical protein